MKKKLTLLFLLILLTGCTPPLNDNPADDNPSDDTPPIVEEVDTEAPVIELLGDTVVYIVVNREFVDPLVTITDNKDTALEVVVSGDTVDTSTLGIYELEYDVTDTSGNVAQTVTREVYVINRDPGMVVSFGYESYNYVGVTVQTFDINNLILDVTAYLYNGETLVDSLPIESSNESFEFTGLETGVDYELIVKGNYNMGLEMGYMEFASDPIFIGTYRRLDDDLREEFDNDALFDAVQSMVLLPYNNSEEVVCERVVSVLKNVDEELIIGIAEHTYDQVILTPLTIPSVPDYWHLRGEEAVPGSTWDTMSGLCCGPMVVRYQGGSVPENVLMHEIGHSVDLMLLNGLSYTDEFIQIHEEEKPLMFPDDTYFDTSWEYFAESFSYYYLGKHTSSELLEKAPKTYAYMASLVDRYNELYGENN